MTKISKEEYELLKGLDDQWKWIARDLDGDHGGDLFIYPEKPFKNTYAEGWVYGMRFRYIDNRLFQFVQWDDSEPYSITELIEGYEKESEETELKSKQELIEKWESAIESAEFYGKGKEERLISYMKEFASDLKQLNEPEVLSQEWIDKNKFEVNGWDEAVHVEYLQNLLVPKQEEQSAKTVADVITDFYKSLERLKEVLGTEVEEMEENDQQ